MLVTALVAAAVVAVLRLRKLHRDDTRARNANRDTHPTSPYVVSKGFRLVAEDEGATATPVVRRPDPSRPRLEPGREYVFSDGQLPHSDEGMVPAGRHDSKWALERSAHRPRFSVSSRRVLTLALILIAVLVVAGLFLNHHHVAPAPGGIGSLGERRLEAGPVETGTRYPVERGAGPRATPAWLWSEGAVQRSVAS